MRPMSILFSAIIFVTAIICAVGFNAGLVSDYSSSLGTTSKINTSEWDYEEIESLTGNQTDELETGLVAAVGQIPIIGSSVVQVISPLQTVKSFFDTVWDSINIATTMISSIFEIIPKQYGIPDDIRGLIYTSITLMVMGSVVYLILNRKVF